MIKKIETTKASSIEYIVELIEKVNELVDAVNAINVKTKKMKPGNAYDLGEVSLGMRGNYK